MSEQEYEDAVGAVVARWHRDRRGEPLTSLAFDGAVPAQCHANAAAFVASHGGEVVHGFLVQHPQDWPMVWVIAHSVVRTEAGLADVTLPADQLRWLGFFPLFIAIEGFVELAQQFPRESRPIVS